MRKVILMAVALTLAGCGGQGDARICRTVAWSGDLILKDFATTSEAQDAYRQCLIHYSYLLARDGGSEASVTDAVKARCQLPGGRFEHYVRQDLRGDRHFSDIPLAEREIINIMVADAGRKMLEEIPNFIVEARAGNCRP